MMQLFFATRNGLAVSSRQEDDWQVEYSALSDQHVTSVIARQGVVLAGTRTGIFRSDDSGRSWIAANRGLTARHVRWLAYHPKIADLEFAGTEPAGVFVSRDGGGHWESSPDTERFREENKWFLPYSPEAGCVRGFAFADARIYAAVEVGGVVISPDRGRSWVLMEATSGRPSFGQPAKGRLHPDVHDVITHPSEPKHLYAPTGGGFYRSVDGGESWECLHGGYVRAAWIPTRSPDTIVLGPAKNSSGADGSIELSTDGGASWHRAHAGLDAPWSSKMVERFFAFPDQTRLMAVLSNGEVWVSTWPDMSWRSVLPQLPGVNAITSMRNKNGL